MIKLALYVLVFVVASASQGCKDNSSVVNEHFSKYQHSFVDAARKTLIEFGPRERLPVSDLPVSLQLPGLRFAETFPTHINLVTYANPDTVSGYRIWIEGPDDQYRDTPTAYPAVTRYTYCDDYPESPKNHP